MRGPPDFACRGVCLGFRVQGRSSQRSIPLPAPKTSLPQCWQCTSGCALRMPALEIQADSCICQETPSLRRHFMYLRVMPCHDFEAWSPVYEALFHLFEVYKEFLLAA
ncbi:unnamed protein product, partial [Symbiodinium sp. KB8]